MIRRCVLLEVIFLIAVTESAHYLGCFRERSLQDRLFKGDHRNFTTNNTHEVCIAHCRSKGFLYAGVQFGRQCFCSNERPSYEWLAKSEDECNMPCSGDQSQFCGAHMRLGVYSLADPEPGSLPTSYIGCHAGGALREVMGQSKDLSLEACKDFCVKNRYRYFGAAEGSKCFCGNDVTNDRTSERECRVPCGGDKTQLCGGSSEQLSVYRTSISKTETAHYLGCFRERSIQDRIFKGDHRNFTTNNTHEVCIDHCRSKGFLFAGVQFGRQCFCSSERPSYEWLANSEDDCKMPCSGDPSQVCGAHMRMGVYSLADPEPGSLSTSYIGCHAAGALREVMGQSKDLSLEACKDFCEENRYRYFGAAQGSKCFCGNDIVSDSISERECRVPCGGDNNQLCGGSSEKLSVYRSSIPEPDTAQYLGCFRERSLQDRLFKGDHRNFTTINTHEVCIDHCRSNGFLYAGVQFGRQCFCSNERPSYEWLANSEDECNMPCSGKPSQFCGAHMRLGVYSLADPEPGSLSTSYIGCHAGGALREVMGQSRDLSLEGCKDFCEANRYRYFGAAQGSKCFCGNDIVSDSISERECRIPCGGDQTQLCGGTSEQLSVYRTSIQEPKTAHYLGCFRERSLKDRLFKGDLRNFTTNNTHEVCIAHCRSKGFLFAGVQFGRQCFCSNERPSYEWLANSEDECNMPCSGDPSQVCGAHRRMGVYSLADPEPGSLPTSYIGCHAAGALREVMGQSKDLSLEACKDFCEENRYRYFGAAEGSKCFCANDVTSDKINERECRVPCGGDKTQLCGGSSEQLSLYRSSIPEPETAHYLGCFRERSLQDRLFKGDHRNFTTNNTHEVCIAHCRSKGFLFAGVQFGRQCFCSNEHPSYEWLANSEDECNMPCSGDPSQVCGAHRRMGVYSLSDPEPESLSTYYIGCHVGGALREVMGQSKDLSLEACKDFCEENRYRYFGAAQGTNCLCGNDIVRDSVSERECRVPCGGDKTQLCGGSSEQLSVYRTSITDEMILDVTTIDASLEETTVPFSTEEETETWTVETETEPVTTYSTTTMRSTEMPVANTYDRPVNTTTMVTTNMPDTTTTTSPVSTTPTRPTEMPTLTTTGRPLSTTTSWTVEIETEPVTTYSTTTMRTTEVPVTYTYARPVITTTMQPTEMPALTTTGMPVTTTTTRPTELPAATTSTSPVSTTTTQPTEIPETTSWTVEIETEPVTTYSTTTMRPTEMPSTYTYARPVSTTTMQPTEMPSLATTGMQISTTTTRPTELPEATTTTRPVSPTTTRPTEMPETTSWAVEIETEPVTTYSTTTMRPTEMPSTYTYARPVSTTTIQPTEKPSLATTGMPVSTTTTRPTELPASTTTTRPVSTTTTRPTEMPALTTTGRPLSTTTPWIVELETEPVTTYSTTTLLTSEKPATFTYARPVSTTTMQPTEMSALLTTSRPVSTTTTRPTELPMATTSTTTTQPTEMPTAYTYPRPVSTTTTRPTEVPLITTGRPVKTTTTEPTKLPAATISAKPISTTTTRPTELPAVTTTARPVSTTTTRPTEMRADKTSKTTNTQLSEVPALITTGRPVSTTTTRPTEMLTSKTYARPVNTTTIRPSEVPALFRAGGPVSTTTTHLTKVPSASTSARSVTTTTMRPMERTAPTTTGRPISTTTTQPTRIISTSTTARPISTTTLRSTEKPALITASRPVSTTTTQLTKIITTSTTARPVSTTTMRPIERTAPSTTGRPVSTTTTQPTRIISTSTTARPLITTTTRPTAKPAPTTTGRPVSTTTTQPTRIISTSTTARPVSTTTMRPIERTAPTSTGRPVSTTTTQSTRIPAAMTTARPVSTTTTRPTERTAPSTTGRPVSTTTTQSTRIISTSTTARLVSTTTMRPIERTAHSTTGRPVSTTTTQPTRIISTSTTARPVSTTTMRPIERTAPSTTGRPVSTTTTQPTRILAAMTTARPVTTTTNTRPTERPALTTITWLSPSTTMRMTERPAYATYAWQYNPTSSWSTQSEKYKKGKKSGSSEEKKNKKGKKDKKSKSKEDKKYKKSKEDKKDKKSKKKSKRSIAMYTSHALGCYKDEHSQLLPDLMVKLYLENTPQACVDLCAARNYSYAGLHSHECFCSKTMPDKKNEINSKDCFSSCPGNSLEICGGRGATSVFEIKS